MLDPRLQFNNTECVMQSKVLVSSIQSGVFRLKDRRLWNHQFTMESFGYLATRRAKLDENQQRNFSSKQLTVEQN